MLSAGTDGDLTSSSGLGSTTDHKIKTALQNSQLHELNQSIMRENAHLRGQLDSALQLSQKVTSLQQENARLQSQIRSLQSDNDDLKDRLDISIRAVAELNQKISAEKQNAVAERAVETQNYRREIGVIEERNRAAVNQLSAEIAALNARVERSDIENLTLKAQLAKVVQAGSRYFQTKIGGIEVLVDRLDKPEPIATVEAVQVREVPSKKDRKKVKMLQKALGEHESMVNDLKTEIGEEAARHRQECEGIRASLAKASEEQSAVLKEKTRTIHRLKQKVAELNKEVTALKRKSIAPPCSTAPRPSLRPFTVARSPAVNVEPRGQEPRARSPSPVVTDLSLQVEDLSRQLQSVKVQNEELRIKLAAAENLAATAQLETSRVKADLTSATVICDESRKEIDTLKASLAETMKARTAPTQKKALRRLTAENKTLKAQLAARTTDIERLHSTHETSVRAQTDLEAKLREQMEQVERSNHELASAKSDLWRARNTPIPKPPPTEIPAASFQVAGLPVELTQLIAPIVSNPVFSAATSDSTP
jgi:chromosome segregation ATPase